MWMVCSFSLIYACSRQPSTSYKRHALAPKLLLDTKEQSYLMGPWNNLQSAGNFGHGGRCISFAGAGGLSGAGASMIYRTLGNTGEKVSVIGLGGSHIGKVKDANESIRIMRTAI